MAQQLTEAAIERAAIALWQHEARETMVYRQRTPRAWLDQSDELRDRWRGFARAALEATEQSQ